MFISVENKVESLSECNRKVTDKIYRRRSRSRVRSSRSIRLAKFACSFFDKSYRMLLASQVTSYILKANDPSSPYFKVRGGYLTTLRLPASCPGTPTGCELIGCSFNRANQHPREDGNDPLEISYLHLVSRCKVCMFNNGLIYLLIVVFDSYQIFLTSNITLFYENVYFSNSWELNWSNSLNTQTENKTSRDILNDFKYGKKIELVVKQLRFAKPVENLINADKLT